MNFGTAFPLMRDAAQDAWQAYTRHAFVQGLSDGTLPRDAFLHYLKQDYVFLIHFARAWALAIVKSETHDEMLAAVGTVNGLITEEISLHIGICKEAGISEDELRATPERAENLAYTRYVLEAGYSGDFLDLLAALAPCVMGYGEIGLRLQTEATSDTYRAWIETYAGSEYQSLCNEVGQAMDASLSGRLGPDYTGSPRWSALCDRFKTATELEIAFWQMGLTP